MERSISLIKRSNQSRSNIKHSCEENIHPSGIIAHFVVIFSPAMILAIWLLIVWHMQGIRFISTEDIELFLNSVVTLDVSYVKMLAIRPNISNFLGVSRDSFRKSILWKLIHIRRRRINKWNLVGGKSSKDLPPKHEACMVSWVAYDCIMSFMEILNCASRWESVWKDKYTFLEMHVFKGSSWGFGVHFHF